MILIIDNYDSFTYNLFQYLGELGQQLTVVRNDAITVEECDILSPARILISPGPCTPKEAGISCDVIRHFAGKVPLFGVCLGHQCIGDVFGGEITRSRRLMHGKVSPITHNGTGIFKEIPSPFEATRYHSLEIRKDSCPDCLDITALADDDEIMGIRHTKMPIVGVQFHPESILTQHGKQMLQNFIEM